MRGLAFWVITASIGAAAACGSEARRASDDDGGQGGQGGGEAGGGGVPVTSCEACAAPIATGELGPDYLFTLSTTVAPALPFLFDAVPTLGTDGLFLRLQPLDAMMRTPVGNPAIVGPFELDGGYCLEGELPQIDIPGEANPISGNPISATLTLRGAFCSPGDFICGIVPAGEAVVGGAPLDVSGSTWAMERLSAPGAYPAQPRLGCEG